MATGIYLRKKRGKYIITREHTSRWQGDMPICKDCGKKLSRRDATRCMFCNRKLNSGSGHYNWKGGICSQNYLERRKFRYEMQETVFKRDNYTCQLCGKRGGSLQVDHIQSWTDYVEQRFDLNNCRTLCMDCHYFITYGKPRPENIKAWGHNLKGVFLQ